MRNLIAANQVFGSEALFVLLVILVLLGIAYLLRRF